MVLGGETCRSVFNVLMCKCCKFYICAVVGVIIEFLRNVGKFKQTTRRHNPADRIMKLLRFLNIIFMQPVFQIRLSG